MKIGDQVFCKNRGTAVIINLDYESEHATVLFLKIGMYNPEVISYKDYEDFGSETKAKEAGRMRVEGKDYIVQDGDVMHFRFNV